MSYPADISLIDGLDEQSFDFVVAGPRGSRCPGISSPPPPHGFYTNSTLFLLAFDTTSRTLTLNSTIPGFGLHQFVTSNEAKVRVYATTMSEPPRLFTWGVDENLQFTHLSTNNITSSACYISNDGQYSFSAGGPTAQINSLGDNGVIGNQTNELYLIPVEDIDSVDKTRNAVLHGAHAFNVNVNNKGFVPHLGMNSIFMYDIADNGTAQLQSINLSPTEGDGPRNSYSSEDGKLLYVVPQWLDVYEVGETQLKHIQRASVIPEDVRGYHTFRSNTVQPSKYGKYLFTSTRSWESPEVNGYAAVFEVNDDGYLIKEHAVTFYEAPVTLEDETNCDPEGLTDYMYLSDTSQGWIFILGWTPSEQTLDLVASLQYPDNASPYEATWLD
ncbi:Lactonase, 7-bladed beta-propeller-domain-containing protein [Aspergillus cavernicola]|uniref:Lactonase, 7-bladed beta-propeller-domain-containing protein n=1 Tax=Aspergillus cavernicola TaxID=176166 RepID=A0ABR4IE09_9EURO